MDSLVETIGQLLWRVASFFVRLLVSVAVSQLLDRTVGRYFLWPIVEWCFVRPFWLAVDIVCLITRTLTDIVLKLYPEQRTRPATAMPTFADARYDALRQPLIRPIGGKGKDREHR